MSNVYGMRSTEDCAEVHNTLTSFSEKCDAFGKELIVFHGFYE
jgi:hypothetical protein